MGKRFQEVRDLFEVKLNEHGMWWFESKPGKLTHPHWSMISYTDRRPCEELLDWTVQDILNREAAGTKLVV